MQEIELFFLQLEEFRETQIIHWANLGMARASQNGYIILKREFPTRRVKISFFEATSKQV